MWITVFGNGSFSLGPGSKIWRGPASYEITDEQAEECLAYKEANPDSNLFVVSTTKSDLDQHGKPPWMLRPSDLAWHKPTDQDEPDRASPDADYEPQEDEYPCGQCSASFTSVAGLAQHTALHHVAVHEHVEDDARAQLAAEKERKAIEERIRQADAKELRPEERPIGEGEPESPLGPHLWPPGLRGNS